MMSFRRTLFLVLLCALSIGTIGCSLVEAVPAHRLNLVGTAWSVVSIDDIEIAESGRPSVTFVDDLTAKVDTGCRDIELEYALDTDGAALGFQETTSPAPSCDPALAPIDARLVAAVAGTESWTVVSDNVIELKGTHQMSLQRMQ